MEITKEVLQARKDSLGQQLGTVLEEAAELRGAIMVCDLFMAHLETPEPKEEEVEDSSSEE